VADQAGGRKKECSRHGDCGKRGGCPKKARRGKRRFARTKPLGHKIILGPVQGGLGLSGQKLANKDPPEK